MNLNFTREIRSFNRFYTHKIGLIARKFLNSEYSLVQARVLFELSRNSQIYAKDLVSLIGLDPAYLSKILKKFEKDCLITKRTSSKDSRKQKISLTQKGQDAYATLREISNIQITALIQNLSEEQKRSLVNSMQTIEELLHGEEKNSDIYLLRSHRPGDIGFIIHRHGVLYAQKYGFNDAFDGYVAKGLANFIESYTPSKEHLWVAEKKGKIIGSIAIVRYEEQTAQLRWLLVEPTEQGKGVGRKLVNEAIIFAKQNGYRKIILWTIDFLKAARKLYSTADFKLVETKENKVWGKDLVEEKWELVL